MHTAYAACKTFALTKSYFCQNVSFLIPLRRLLFTSSTRLILFLLYSHRRSATMMTPICSWLYFMFVASLFAHLKRQKSSKEMLVMQALVVIEINTLIKVH